MSPELLDTTLDEVQICPAAPSSAVPVRVTIDNFKRAETDHYFTKFVNQGGFGKLQHVRSLTPIEHQMVIRLNRDTLYTCGVFDLDAAPVTVTLPDAGARYMAVQVVDEDHCVTEVFHAPGRRTLTRKAVGARYVALLVRVFVNPNQPDDTKAVHALQDAIQIEQELSGTFEAPLWDQDSLEKVRNAILNLAGASGSFDSSRMFGSRNEVDPVHHLIGAASAWGGNPRAEATYMGGAPAENDGVQAYLLTLAPRATRSSSSCSNVSSIPPSIPAMAPSRASFEG